MNFKILTFGFSVHSHKEVYIECDPCLNDGTKVTASHFCKTCVDPEPLCETCAKQHTRQKAFRDHEVSGNINKFPVHHLNKRYMYFKYFGRLKMLQYLFFG